MVESSVKNSAGIAGRVALVTGGSRGLGAAICRALAAAGADVAVNYRSYASGAEAVCRDVEAAGRRGMVIQADVSDSGEVARMAAEIEAALGGVDILVNNAGVLRAQPIEEITEADWDETIDVNLKSAFLCAQAVLPGMRANQWGRIVNISSLAAQVGGFVGPHYSASKAGMLDLTHSYATLLVKEGITANAVAPALIDTDMVRSSPQVRPELVPVGRFGTPEEHAEAVVMLARNAYITGQTINVNGGMYFS